MIRKYKQIFIFILCIIATGCSNNDDEITPSDISDITSTPGAGYIKLEWEKPDDGTIYYTKVKYFDPLEQREMWRLSSTDTIRIPNTRAKFGEYDFSLETFSHSGKGSGVLHFITAVSGIAPATEVVIPIKLTGDQLSTNAQSVDDPIERLVDGKTDTFFHTTWQDPVPEKPHWIQIELMKELKVFQFQYAPRQGNSSNRPVNFDLFGSMNSEDWFLIKNFTKEADNLPVSGTDEYKSPTITSPQSFKYLKYSVNETNTETVYWSMSEFRLYTVDITDPEAEETEVKKPIVTE